MEILLDTHIWLWMNEDPKKLSLKSRKLVEKTENQLYLSVASIWEVAIKYRQGKLLLHEDPEQYIPKRLIDNGVTVLPIESTHVLKAASLPFHHHDPFDRILVAQAQIFNIPLMTVDAKLRNYEVELI